jgi:hypothetical protein
MFTGFIGLGRKIESMENQIRFNKEQAEKHDLEIKVLMSVAQKIETHDETIKKILALFTDSEGNQRIMTSHICDKKSDACNMVISERMKHMGEMFGERINALASELQEHRKMSREQHNETIKAVVEAVERIRQQGARDQ